MQMKEAKCMYCKTPGTCHKKASIHSYKCEHCHMLWRRIRNRRKKFATGITVHELIRWFIAQPQECKECGLKENLTFDRIIPESKGGLYHPDNLQILCYTCNCCKKLSAANVAKGTEDDTEKKCNGCNEIFPLTTEYWHKSSFKAKYRNVTKSMFHPKCKSCRSVKMES